MSYIDRARLSDIVSAAGLELDKDVFADYQAPGHRGAARVLAVRGLPELSAFLGEAARSCDVDEYAELFGVPTPVVGFTRSQTVFFRTAQVVDF